MSSRLSKTEILERFRACCQKLGKTPGQNVFSKTTGTKRADIRYYWAKQNDLAKEAGKQSPVWTVKIPEPELFEDYAKICLHLRKIPTGPELRIATRQLKTHHVSSRFRSMVELDERFRTWLGKQSEDLRQILDFPG